MTDLDFLPEVDSFFGLDLKTGSMMIAVMGIAHPMAYGCTFFVRMSCLIITIWTLVVIFFATSIALLFGIINENKELCLTWIYYELFFSFTMFILMLMLAIVYGNREQYSRVLVTVFGMLYYIFSNYFIIVVNSYRKKFK